MITTTTHGVGINRNLALFYATGDILLLADDDMVYADGYPEMVRKAFADWPDARGDQLQYLLWRRDGVFRRGGLAVSL